MFAEFLVEWIKGNWKRQEGQTMAEYGIILGLITLGVIALLVTLGGQIQSKFQGVVDALTGH
jgi:pilus assembly protein Flp/PilA